MSESCSKILFSSNKVIFQFNFSSGSISCLGFMPVEITAVNIALKPLFVKSFSSRNEFIATIGVTFSISLETPR